VEALFFSMQLHIGYLRSLEDSERVRAVCVKFLQDSLPWFYPDRLDIVKQAEQLAATLGGRWRSRVYPGSTPGSRNALAGLWPTMHRSHATVPVVHDPILG